MRRVLFEVWVSLGFWLSFEIDCSLPAFDFYEGADLTALGRPLKIDRQITPPLINAAPLWDGSILNMWEEIRDLARLK